MWFGMMILFSISFVYSIKYLRGFKYRNDIFASNFAAVGSLFGILGYLTGMLWVSVTWVTDQGQSMGSVMKEPKLIGAAIALLINGFIRNCVICCIIPIFMERLKDYLLKYLIYSHNFAPLN